MDKFRKFMMDRYGMDQLYKALIFVSITLSFLSIFTDFKFLNNISLALLIFATYRAFSKNKEKRYRENIAFLNWYNPLRNKLIKTKNRLKDMKTHKFLKCPKCRQTLRVPKGKGKILITCPKCDEKFKTRT